MAKNKKKIGWIISGIVLALIVLVVILLQSASFLRMNFDSYGHGLVSANGFTSFLQSLKILNRVDYVDEVTGEEVCFSDICWALDEMEYETCYDSCDDAADDYCYLHTGDIYSDEYEYCMDSFYDEIGGCLDNCEDTYIETLFSDCVVNCEGEIYIWDGTPVTDLGAFASTAFPNFVERAQLICNDWFLGGTWVSTYNRVGCINAGWISCDTRSVESAGEVCETIGKDWTCSDEEAICEG